MIDADSDNDTIPDVVENPDNSQGGGDADTGGSTNGNGDNGFGQPPAGGGPQSTIDTDGDGIPDYQDLDSDNDGIPDALEGAVQTELTGNDQDGDGIDDALDVDQVQGSDTNGNGINDALEPQDSDGDGLPDYLDSDSDDDGVPDVMEGLGDVDGDGLLNHLDVDSDNDGIDDGVEDASVPPLSFKDSDFDGIDDAIDVTSTGGRDDDLNGIDDRYDPKDFDRDGVQDRHDLDSDNDGISDQAEGDADTDGDGQPDRLDLDTDNDGIADAIEGNRDTDSDGVPDYQDLDSDNDGISDYIEVGGEDVDGDSRIDGFTDINKDGLDDRTAVNPMTLINSDADPLPDYRDLDSDNDALSDLLETHGTGSDVNADGRVDGFVDENRDGLDDTYALMFSRPEDIDHDGLFNHRDPDSDGDGYFDLIEGGRVDLDGDGMVDQMLDRDADGIPDLADVTYTGGVDVDGDGIDDSADASFQLGDDRDGDGIIDSRDPDANGDGVADVAMNGEPQLSAALPDLDGNGIADVLDANGEIVTGLNGVGCSIASGASEASGSSGTSGPSRTDPMLLLLCLLASLCLLRSHGARCRITTLLPAALVPGQHWTLLMNLPLRPLKYLPVSPLVFLLLSLSAQASEDSGFRRLYYGTVGVGISQLGPDASDVPIASVKEASPAAAQLSLGLDFRKRFSAEMHMTELGEADFGMAGQIGYQTLGISALGYVGKNHANVARRGLTGYARMGLGYMNNSASGVTRWSNRNAMHLVLGAGVEYMGRKGLGVRAEYIGFDADAKYLQLALIYRFNARESRSTPLAGATPQSTESAARVKPLTNTAQPAGNRTDTESAAQTPTSNGKSISATAVTKDLPADGPEVNAPALAISRTLQDRDGDGVADTIDRCLQSPRGIAVNAQGCTVYAGVIDGVNFYSGSSTLTPEAEALVTTIARDLRKYPDALIAVAAHTDSDGDELENRQLSQQRAIAVLRLFVKAGIDKQRLSGKAFGAARPIASNDTEAGRLKNRRVEIMVEYDPGTGR
jgi:outer membrane protein OmpA-like peptidoglycan-associated protein